MRSFGAGQELYGLAACDDAPGAVAPGIKNPLAFNRWRTCRKSLTKPIVSVRSGTPRVPESGRFRLGAIVRPICSSIKSTSTLSTSANRMAWRSPDATRLETCLSEFLAPTEPQTSRALITCDRAQFPPFSNLSIPRALQRGPRPFQTVVREDVLIRWRSNTEVA